MLIIGFSAVLYYLGSQRVAKSNKTLYFWGTIFFRFLAPYATTFHTHSFLLSLTIRTLALSNEETMDTKEKKRTKKEKENFDMSGPWTPEKLAEFRKLMPKKLNKFGEKFFAGEGLKEYLIVKDWRAVMK